MVYPTMVTSDYMTCKNQTDSDIQYDQQSIFDDFVYFPLKDSVGFDIKSISKKDFLSLKTAANEEKDCIAFNTYGYLKHDIHLPKNFIDIPNNENKSKMQGLYVRREYLEKKIKKIN